MHGSRRSVSSQKCRRCVRMRLRRRSLLPETCDCSKDIYRLCLLESCLCAAGSALLGSMKKIGAFESRRQNRTLEQQSCLTDMQIYVYVDWQNQAERAGHFFFSLTTLSRDLHIPNVKVLREHHAVSMTRCAPVKPVTQK